MRPVADMVGGKFRVEPLGYVGIGNDKTVFTDGLPEDLKSVSIEKPLFVLEGFKAPCFVHTPGDPLVDGGIATIATSLGVDPR
jgi:hypothetical protein